jgi:hypothetical protein
MYRATHCVIFEIKDDIKNVWQAHQKSVAAQEKSGAMSHLL